MSDLTKIGTTIKELREIRGWNRSELGEKADITAPTVAKYERRAHAPSLKTLTRIANAFDAKPSDLLQDAGL
jgi:transcriptional regulator with XRE-family HTH domain